MKFSQLSPKAQEQALNDYIEDYGGEIMLDRVEAEKMILNYDDLYVFNEDGELEYMNCMHRLRM